MLHVVLFTALLTICVFKVIVNRRNRNRLPYPPGPKGLPLIGNIFDVPSTNAWLKFDEWFKQYGDLISFRILNQQFVVVGSLEKAFDLFETRSSQYSDRPRMIMLNEMMGCEVIMSLMKYGTSWRRQRKMFHDHFHPNVVEKYIPTQTREIRMCLLRLLESPAKFDRHITQTFTNIMLDITYGIRIGPENTHIVDKLEYFLHIFTEAATPGRYLVDSIPALQYVPDWMPGAGFKAYARNFKEILETVADDPWDLMVEGQRHGTATPCVTATLLEQLASGGDPQKKQEIKHLTTTAYLGGSETTGSSIKSFFLAMAMYPGVQKKAQLELDTVIGPHRLPEYSDRSSLPYINAMVKETVRWLPVTPFAGPHTVSEDDVYNGYYIPKGTTVLGNSWSMLHDPNVYPEPEEFKPERFMKDGKLDPNVRNPSLAAFGFGRRACPGRYLSDNSTFLFISSVLAAFNIEPPRDKDGNTVQLKVEVVNGIISSPAPFECIITPRSATAANLIKESLEFAMKYVGDSDCNDSSSDEDTSH